ncbi:MAG: hypothetical protein RR246_02970, partial [Clostridia bacterium]
NPPSVINALVFGIFAAIGFAKTKSILICVVLHMTNNAISFMVAYLISNANMFAFAMLFSVFTIGTIGFAIAFLVNMLVSKRRSSISLSPQLSNLPRIRSSFIAKSIALNPFSWFFATLLAYSILVLYI